MKGTGTMAIKATFVVDPNAKPMTADIFCRSVCGMSEKALIKQLQIYGNDYLDQKIAELKGAKPPTEKKGL
jgi:cytochrome P450